MSNGWIGVDLDATLAVYDEWKGIDHIGAPIQPMCERVKAWLLNGQDVRIFTARVAHDNTPEGKHQALLAMSVVENWCIEQFGRPLRVTCVKDWSMVELWDDRAIQVVPNTGRRVDGL